MSIRVAGVYPAPREGPALVDRSEFERWRRAAEQALAAARAEVGAGLHHWACFLAEQSAQLSVKGFLHGIGGAPWGHDLVGLGASVSAAVEAAALSGVEASLRRLARHYIPARYPDAVPGGGPGEHYGPEDSKEAVADAVAVLQAIDALWRRIVAASER